MADILPRNFLFKDQAIQEMAFSGLPGRGNGPADAFRHILWAAYEARIGTSAADRNHHCNFTLPIEWKCCRNDQ